MVTHFTLNSPEHMKTLLKGFIWVPFTSYTILRQLKIEIAHAKFADFLWS